MNKWWHQFFDLLFKEKWVVVRFTDSIPLNYVTTLYQKLTGFGYNFCHEGYVLEPSNLNTQPIFKIKAPSLQLLLLACEKAVNEIKEVSHQEVITSIQVERF